MTNTSSVTVDDTFIEGLRALQAPDKTAALIDVALDTATWQPARQAEADGRAR